MIVFVYGTLTDPNRVESVLSRSGSTTDIEFEFEFRASATLVGLRRIEGRYPTLVPDPDGSVEGRLLAVDQKGLEVLDEYEGVESGLYVRVSVPYLEGSDPREQGERANETNRSVYIYVGNPDRLGGTLEANSLWTNTDSFQRTVREYVSNRRVRVIKNE